MSVFPIWQCACRTFVDVALSLCVCVYVFWLCGVMALRQQHDFILCGVRQPRKKVSGGFGAVEKYYLFSECLLYMLAKAPENPFTCKLEWRGRKSAVGTSTIALRMRLLSVNCINLFSFSALEAGLNGDWKILVFVPVDASKLKHKSS